MLHVTNGDAAAGLIASVGLRGEIVPWRDALHEGPVPAGISDGDLAAVRAQFIAEAGWAPYDEVLSGFAARDTALAACGEHEELVLWFEHDLYDQLQLVQILERLARLPALPSALSIICIGTFPDVADFHGLGQLTAAQIASLFPGRRPVTAEQLATAQRAWRAFCGADPRGIEVLLRDDCTALPYLAPALRRQLEQFPGVPDGLSRSERQILQVVDAGVRLPAAIFGACQQHEEAPFLGDTVVWSYLAELQRGPAPLLASAADAVPPPAAAADAAAFLAQELELTEIGRVVLAGAADRVALNGIDRWLGGVHLHGAGPAWRWDTDRRELALWDARAG